MDINQMDTWRRRTLSIFLVLKILLTLGLTAAAFAWASTRESVKLITVPPEDNENLPSGASLLQSLESIKFEEYEELEANENVAPTCPCTQTVTNWGKFASFEANVGDICQLFEPFMDEQAGLRSSSYIMPEPRSMAPFCFKAIEAVRAAKRLFNETLLVTSTLLERKIVQQFAVQTTEGIINSARRGLADALDTVELWASSNLPLDSMWYYPGNLSDPADPPYLYPAVPYRAVSKSVRTIYGVLRQEGCFCGTDWNCATVTKSSYTVFYDDFDELSEEVVSKTAYIANGTFIACDGVRQLMDMPRATVRNSVDFAKVASETTCCGTECGGDEWQARVACLNRAFYDALLDADADVNATTFATLREGHVSMFIVSNATTVDFEGYFGECAPIQCRYLAVVADDVVDALLNAVVVGVGAWSVLGVTLSVIVMTCKKDQRRVNRGKAGEAQVEAARDRGVRHPRRRSMRSGGGLSSTTSSASAADVVGGGVADIPLTHTATLGEKAAPRAGLSSADGSPRSRRRVISQNEGGGGVGGGILTNSTD